MVFMINIQIHVEALWLLQIMYLDCLKVVQEADNDADMTFFKYQPVCTPVPCPVFSIPTETLTKIKLLLKMT